MRIWATCWPLRCQDTESTGDPSTVLGSHSARPDHGPRCGQGLHPPADQDPDHPTWRTFWERPDPYELGELRDYLGDRLPLRIARLEAVGEGRNVTLFDGLRKWAYRARLGYSDWHLWERACRSHADALNAFASPLTTREAHQVAKSVAKWTWTNITPTAFSKIQAERGSQNGANKKIAAMDFTAEIVRYAR